MNWFERNKEWIGGLIALCIIILTIVGIFWLGATLWSAIWSWLASLGISSSILLFAFTTLLFIVALEGLVVGVTVGIVLFVAFISFLFFIILYPFIDD